jgi:hypothetical protein
MCVISFWVCSDYDEDSLESNLLHLSSPSTILLDETRLTPGTLNGTGICNLQALSKMLMSAQLDYDFQFQALSFDVDWAVLLLSAGGRTLLQQEGAHGIDLGLKLAPSSAEQLYALGDLPRPTEQQLDYWRAYLIIARQNNFQIAPEMSQVGVYKRRWRLCARVRFVRSSDVSHLMLSVCVQSIEDHFVSLRRSRPTVTSESTLHLLLNFARYVDIATHDTRTLARISSRH